MARSRLQMFAAQYKSKAYKLVSLHDKTARHVRSSTTTHTFCTCYKKYPDMEWRANSQIGRMMLYSELLEAESIQRKRRPAVY